MSDTQNEAGDGAAITTGEDAAEQPVTIPAAEAAPSGGETVQEEKPIETAAAEAPAGEKPADEAPPAEPEKPAVVDEPRPTLAETAAKKAAEREEEEKPANVPEAETAKPEADKKAEGEEAKPPAEAKPDDEAEAEKPKAEPEEEAAVEEEKPADLKVEDVDKVHEKDSPTARERIKALAQRRDTLVEELNPLKETFEVLGGQEGVDEILSKIEIIENPAKASEFLELVEKSPNFAAFRDKHFWKELDNPDNLALIVQDKLGEDYTVERLEKLVELDKKGLIDVDAIEDRTDSFNLSDDQKIAKAEGRTEAERLRAENAKLKEKVTETTSAEQQQAEAKRWMEFGTAYDAELFPTLQEMGVLPLPDDAPEIVEAKERHWSNVVATSQKEYEANPEFQEIAKLIKAGATDTITFRNKVRGFKPVYLDIAKKATIKELPFLNGTLEALYKQKGAGKAKAAAATAAAPTPGAQPPNPSTPQAGQPAKEQSLQTEQPTKAPGTDLRSASGRKDAFAKAAERSANSRRT